ncbi:cytochrome P450 6B5 [Manduca sexta]|uniref:unspecific monooxygenase n=1 Tax=Manduca sexta TaxID=7130 RepID=A0A922CNP8_MANSE|nr:cytochrome P450 6B5 [Manduca sexta]KAG6453022.1 hypothetical protein O3G_MSEX007938 [Manduca sexta]KAG6453023.1 hypothetical protein O3G_MSEX007938 [Manduca sexta]
MISSGSFLISIFTVLITAVYYYFKNVNSYWKKSGVVGPEPILFFGNAKLSALRQTHIAILYKQMYEEFTHEKMVGFYRLTTPSLLIRDLDIAKHILIKDFEVFPDRGFEFSKEGLGDSLFHCDFNTWRALKGHLTPLYTTGRLKIIVSLLNERSEKFIDYVESVCLKNPEQEVMSLFLKYTTASIMASAFGVNVDTHQDNSNLFEKIDNAIFTLNYTNEMDLLFPGILKKTNLSIFNEIVQRFCYEVVETVKLQKKDSSAVNDAMDILLALQQQGEAKSMRRQDNEKEASLKLTDHVLAGQAFVFFAAGYGNNTIVLSNAMYHLAKDSEIQDKLITEIDEVLEKHHGDVTYESIKEMVYLEQIFNETLRMHPTTNAIQRSAKRDYVVPGTDIKIEKGTPIVISPLAIHHDEKLYPNPEKFVPERFMVEAVKSRHTCAYLPFGAGPRSCLGMRFAKLQFKACVVKLLSKFRVEPSRRTKDEYFINPRRSLLCPEGGIYLNFVPRTI